ncbi:trimeric intracellular cation channel family protein [Pseudomonas neuropathica]|uniref:trimeric intracellular cation channel family protein n=1 Tax=Pseudomonas neuropathica TaxID=2730425 RepID=UPI003EBD6132
MRHAIAPAGRKSRVERIVLVADLAGTAVFAVEGAIAAMRSQLDLLGVMVIAFIVALGGGVIRDIVLARIPVVLQADLYASSAFVGAAVLVIGRRLGVSPVAAALLAGAGCLLLRLLSVHFGWQLPKVIA